eukprot:973114-Ditylum_brightwellii.AAC.1
MAIVLECFSESYQALSLTKNKLLALNISDYPGENIQDLNLMMSNYSVKLAYVGAFPDGILLEIYAIYKEASDLKFKMWMIN